MPKAKQTDTIQIIKDDIASGSVGSLYLFHGEERYLLEHYLSELRALLVPDGMEEFNLFRFEGRGLNTEQLVDAVEGLPVFSEKKLVIVTDLDVYKPPAAIKPSLEEILADVPDYTCLVFVYDAIEYKTDARAKTGKLIKEHGKIIDFPLREARELVSWLRRRFKACGKDISPAVAEYMLFVCGRQMTALVHEVEKVAAFSGGNVITKENIDGVCTPVLDAVVYDMTDAVADGRFENAFKILGELFDMRSEPIVILAALGRQIRQLLYARAAADEGGGEKLFQEASGISSSYVLRKVMGSARRKPLDWYSRAAGLCAKCDYDMKTSAGDNNELLKTLLLRLAAL